MARVASDPRSVRWVVWIAAAALLVVLVSPASGAYPRRIARNLPEDPPQPFDFCGANQPTIAATIEAVPSLLAIVTVRNWNGEGRMAFEVRNHAPEEIRQVIFDAFTANTNPVHFGWAVREAETLLRPTGGRAAVQYPDVAGQGTGPAVILFEGLKKSQCAVFGVFLECWDHAGECPAISDLGGSRLEVVFANSLRGTGTLEVCPRHGFIWSRGNGRARRIPCEPGSSIAVIRNER